MTVVNSPGHIQNSLGGPHKIKIYKGASLSPAFAGDKDRAFRSNLFSRPFAPRKKDFRFNPLRKPFSRRVKTPRSFYPPPIPCVESGFQIFSNNLLGVKMAGAKVQIPFPVIFVQVMRPGFDVIAYISAQNRLFRRRHFRLSQSGFAV